MAIKAFGGAIDSHLHVWELKTSEYEWITPDLGFLHSDFPVQEAQLELNSAGVFNAILVQIENSFVDSEYLLAIAEKHSWVLGVVGWLPLEDPHAVEFAISQLPAAHSLLGVRHLISKDSERDFYSRKSVIQSAKILEKIGLTIDIPDAWPLTMNSVAEFSQQVPELEIVIDHLGKPPLDDEDFEMWRTLFAESAVSPNVVTKLSGLRKADRPYGKKFLAPLFEEAMNSFGPNRIIFGGDWPVSSENGHYLETVDPIFELISELSESEQDQILRQNAQRVYKISENGLTTARISVEG